jgi:hypothetical protein
MAHFDVHRNSLSDQSQLIVGALDELLSRAWK